MNVRDTDTAKLNRVEALLNRWESSLETMASPGGRELLRATIDAIREAIVMEPERPPRRQS